MHFPLLMAQGLFNEDWPTLRVALSSCAAAGTVSRRIDCAPLVFPLLLPQGGISRRIDCASLVFPLLLPQGPFQGGLTRHSAAFSSSAAAGAPSKQTMSKGDNECRPLLFLSQEAFVSKLPSPSQQKKVKLSFHLLIVCFELFPRIELGTSSLPRKCSTTELKQHLLPKSGTKVQCIFLLCNFFVQKIAKTFYPIAQVVVNNPIKSHCNVP